MTMPQTTVLERIVSETREEVDRRKRDAPPESLRAEPSPGRVGGGFQEAITGPAIAVIAEFKRRSPSAGALREGSDVRQVVGAYQRGGAAAVSVLTEQANFEGTLEDLRTARDACALPVLRKDFIVDPYQLQEAVAVGADAVLLIVAALSQADLQMLHDDAIALGLDLLVEVLDRPELERALSVGAATIGINNRDLRDFSVDVERTFALLGDIPDTVTIVSESGIVGPAQLRRLQDGGVDAVLVGESLMRADDPEAALRKLQSF